MISIVIPTYNRKDVLRHTILALVKQTGDFFEVLICDDGGTDETEKMINQLRTDHHIPFEIKYLRQENKGFRAAAARNMGIKESKGEKIMFIDQDVIIKPNVVAFFSALPQKMYWSGSKQLVPLDFYNARITDEAILNNFNAFDERRHGIIPATLSSLGIIYKKDLDSVDGFDDEFVGYGLEDTELIERLRDVNINGTVERRSFGYHIAHEKNIVHKHTQATYHHKRTHTRRDGKKVKNVR